MIFKRITAYLDRLTAEQDGRAAGLGFVVVRRSRWSSVYLDPNGRWLATARAAGCGCVPVCPLIAGDTPACKAARVLVGARGREQDR